MVRYIVALALLTAYVAGSVLVVRREGALYRDRLNRERFSARPAADPARPTPAPPIPTESVVSTAPLPDPKPPEERPSPTTLAVTRDLRPKADAPSLPPAPPPAPSAATAEPKAPTPAADPLWDAPGMKRVWDLSDLKPEDEKRLGQELHDLVLRFHPKVEVGPMPRRVEEAAEPFVAARARKDVDYTFTVLDSDTVNAFSHPGGYVYVTRGLMDWIGEDDLPSLEFVLAHEVAHVDLQHALSCLRDPGVKALGLGTLPQFLLLIFPRGYFPDRLDLEADLWAYRQMTRLDRTKRERLAFLRKLEGYARDHGFENGRALPKADPDSSPVENHLRAHPAPYKRLKPLNDLTTSAPARGR